jgi:outer membrane cobalamin receptor
LKTVALTVGYLFYFTFFHLVYSQHQTADSAAIDTVRVATETTGHWQADSQATDGLIAEDAVDWMNVMPSVFPLDYGSLGQISPLTFRGSSPQAGGILLDGVPLDEPIHGFANSANLPINLISKMEFAGAGVFTPYGASAAAGLLLLDFYQFSGKRPYSKVLFRAGDWGYSDIGIIFGLPVIKNTSLLIGANRQELDGFQPQSNHKGSRIFGRIAHRASNGLEIYYSGFLNKDDVAVPAPLLPDLVPQLTDSKRKEHRFEQVLSVRVGNLATKNRQLRGRVVFSKIVQESFNDSLLFRNRALTFGAGFQQDLIISNHHLALGGEMKFYDLSSRQLGDHTDRVGQIFVRNAFWIAEKIELGAQFRLEKHSSYSAAFTPSAHLKFEWSPQNQIWLGAQRAERYPSFAERFWPTTFFRGDSSLTGESATTFELGLKNTYKKLQIEAAVFHHQFDDWIGLVATVRDTVTILRPQNLGDRTIRGVDLRLIWNCLSGGQLGVVGSYLHLREDDPAKRLQVPKYVLYSYLEYVRPFFQKFVFVKLRVAGRVFGKRFGLFYPSGATVPEMMKKENDAILDGQISFEFSDAKLSLSIENLLDRDYQLVPGFSMPPKTFRFAIEWEFLD